MYTIRCKKDYENLIDLLKKSANLVKGTYEEIGAGVCVIGSTTAIKDMFEISDEFEKEFIEAISTFNKVQIGPYDTSKYFFMIPTLKKSIKHIVDDCLETRRCVINFPPEHCFQSIQFLIRENTIRVVCFMRSCDAIKNLPHDIWICSKMADIFASYLSKLKNEKPYQYYNIKISFGSLHIYKEDISNVL